jgi:hypothetical protein
MSAFAPTPVAAQSGRVAPVDRRGTPLNALEALERGFALFQSTFAQDGWLYYIGATPFVVGFILVWVINGQIRVSDGTLLLETLLLAGTYLLRVALIARYVRGVRERAFGVLRPKLAGALAQPAGIGRLLAWKITLGSAALITLPTVAAAPWFYGAGQFADLEAQEDASERHSLLRCLAFAGQWYGGSVLLFLMCFPLWAAVWLNAFLLAVVVPQLLQSIFGVNTLLSTEMGIYALFRSYAFWFSLFAGAWLALDPIIKCTFVVVYQHLRSRVDGDDLRGALASLPREQQKHADVVASAGSGRRAIIGASATLALLLLVGSQIASARPAQAPPNASDAETANDSAHQARVQKLRQSLDVESQRTVYRWHDAEHPGPPTWFDRLLVRIGHATSRSWAAFWNILRKLWPRALTVSGGKPTSGALKDLRFWLVLIAILTIGAGAVFIWLRRRREATSVSVPVAIEPLPDLSSAVVASEHSEDEWFALAERLEGEGELRLALRAAYLGLLAGLAQREWLTIRRDRTNREYLDEFTRRWRRRPQAAASAQTETPEKLRSSLRVFDRVWYGSHALTPAAVVAYRQGQRELLSHV